MRKTQEGPGTYNFEARTDKLEELTRLQKQAGLALPTERALWRRAGLTDGMTVLDLGCGPGLIACSMAAEFPSSSIVGVEISETLRARAEETGVHLELNNVRFVQGDVYDLPFEDGMFDFVHARLLFQHLRDPLSVLKQVSRVLKPGGKICVMDVDDRFLLLSPEPSLFEDFRRAAVAAQQAEGGNRQVGGQLHELLKAEGFHNVETLVHVIRTQDCGVKMFLDVAVRFKAARLANHPEIFSMEKTQAALNEFDAFEQMQNAWGALGMFVGLGAKARR